MKKKYSRPMLAFESFQLDAALALNCKIIMHYSTRNCSVDGNGVSYSGGGGEFFGYYNCQTDLLGNGPNGESVCYHGPIATGDVFDIFLQS
jgi:hypothetical protein